MSRTEPQMPVGTRFPRRNFDRFGSPDPNYDAIVVPCAGLRREGDLWRLTRYGIRNADGIIITDPDSDHVEGMDSGRFGMSSGEDVCLAALQLLRKGRTKFMVFSSDAHRLDRASDPDIPCESLIYANTVAAWAQQAGVDLDDIQLVSEGRSRNTGENLKNSYYLLRQIISHTATIGELWQDWHADRGLHVGKQVVERRGFVTRPISVEQTLIDSLSEEHKERAEQAYQHVYATEPGRIRLWREGRGLADAVRHQNLGLAG